MSINFDFAQWRDRIFGSCTYSNVRLLAGLPAIAVPCGFHMESGKKLPVGMQIIGKAFAEAELIQIAHAFEQTADFASGAPQL